MLCQVYWVSNNCFLLYESLCEPQYLHMGSDLVDNTDEACACGALQYILSLIDWISDTP